MMNREEQRLSIYMPSIFWHDRQGILSIDILQQQQQQSTNSSDNVYKIATASMQKEIRVWNFHFEGILSSEATNEADNTQTKVKNPESQSQLLAQHDEDSIVFLNPEKENIKSNPAIKNIDAEIMEVDGPGNGQKRDSSQQNKQSTKASQNLHLSVEFLANLEGHRITTNVVRFSPDGKFLASGDADGMLLVWTLVPWTKPNNEQNNIGTMITKKDQQSTSLRRTDPEMDIPPNKENWIRAFRSPVIRHDGDVTGLCFSPDSQYVASVSMDDSIAVHRADNGKRLWVIRSFRHFANGVVWDPRGKYLITLSTDRRMDILDTKKGTRIRFCHQIELPTTQLQHGIEISHQSYKLFHDDQLCSFQRGVDISPCGNIVFAPAIHLQVGANNVYGTFAFELTNFIALGRPTVLFPTVRPTIQVKCSPILYKLEANASNMLGLPHRLIFAVLCRDSILLYNSQNAKPFAFMENLHYDKLTSLSWTPDGRILVVSSLEGFNSFITMDVNKLGTPCEVQPKFEIFQLEQPKSEKQSQQHNSNKEKTMPSQQQRNGKSKNLQTIL